MNPYTGKNGWHLNIEMTHWSLLKWTIRKWKYLHILKEVVISSPLNLSITLWIAFISALTSLSILQSWNTSWRQNQFLLSVNSRVFGLLWNCLVGKSKRLEIYQKILFGFLRLRSWFNDRTSKQNSPYLDNHRWDARKRWNKYHKHNTLMIKPQLLKVT